VRRLLLAATVLLASCGGVTTSTATASGSPAPSPRASSPGPSASPATAAAITQLAYEVFPPSTPQSHPPGTVGYVECEFAAGVDFQFSNCPVTARFLTRLQQNPSASDEARPFCRCQNILPNRNITPESTPSGGIAHVDLGNAHIDLVMTIQDGRLLVDDSQCPGQGPASSYYVDPVPPCG